MIYTVAEIEQIHEIPRKYITQCRATVHSAGGAPRSSIVRSILDAGARGRRLIRRTARWRVNWWRRRLEWVTGAGRRRAGAAADGGQRRELESEKEGEGEVDCENLWLTTNACRGSVRSGEARSTVNGAAVARRCRGGNVDSST